ncbi:hypothetical protein R1flu_025101 [Riccia fluitans]|uniref:Uncharacterized protein n=1 Tax=Riccia fluitans TaxID=41844 RepID=A0ABD1XX81_9MARC
MRWLEPGVSVHLVTSDRVRDLCEATKSDRRAGGREDIKGLSSEVLPLRPAQLAAYGGKAAVDRLRADPELSGVRGKITQGQGRRAVEQDSSSDFWFYRGCSNAAGQRIMSGGLPCNAGSYKRKNARRRMKAWSGIAFGGRECSTFCRESAIIPAILLGHTSLRWAGGRSNHCASRFTSGIPRCLLVISVTPESSFACFDAEGFCHFSSAYADVFARLPSHARVPAAYSSSIPAPPGVQFSSHYDDVRRCLLIPARVWSCVVKGSSPDGVQFIIAQSRLAISSQLQATFQSTSLFATWLRAHLPLLPMVHVGLMLSASTSVAFECSGIFLLRYSTSRHVSSKLVLSQEHLAI